MLLSLFLIKCVVVVRTYAYSTRIMFRSACSLIFVATSAHAYTTFHTTCATPNNTTNFVSFPDTRGTLDILWSCLFTIFACTWTIQHLNIPEQRGGRNKGWRGDIKWKLKGFWRSLKWMLITIVVPELLLAKNLQDLCCTRKNYPTLQQVKNRQSVFP